MTSGRPIDGAKPSAGDLEALQPHSRYFKIQKRTFGASGGIYPLEIVIIVDDHEVAKYPCSIYCDPRYALDTSGVRPPTMKGKVKEQYIADGVFYLYAHDHKRPTGERYPAFLILSAYSDLVGELVRGSKHRRLPMKIGNASTVSSAQPLHSDVGINLHKGGEYGTTAIGCVTVHPQCYDNFISIGYVKGTWSMLEVSH